MLDSVSCFISVSPTPMTGTVAEPGPAAGAIDLAKATTLSYQLPDANSEIRRLDELQRSFEKDLLKFRPEHKTQQSVLREWLKRNEDLSLVDVNLGDSDATIKQISEEDVSGLGRYALRGDLRRWMDRVATVESNTPAVAGDWTAEDAKAIDGELRDQIKRVVAADANKRKAIHIDTVQRICGQLRFISDGRNFRIDPDFVTDDTQQLLRLAEYVDEWNSHIERHGHPHKQTEAEIAKRIADAEAKRRQLEQGLASAGRSTGLLLTDAQVDQVLNAFYEQRQPSSFLSKTEKTRIERSMVSTLRHAEALDGAAQRSLQRSAATSSDLRLEIEALRRALEAERQDPMRRQNFVDGLEQGNATVQTAAEVLARKRIREAEDVAIHIANEFTVLRQSFDAVSSQFIAIRKENSELKQSVNSLSTQWRQLLALRSQQEQEMERVHGGRVSDLQRLSSTLNEVFSATLEALNRLATGDRTDVRPISRWCDIVAALPGASEGVKSAARDLNSVISSGAVPANAVQRTPSTTAANEDRAYIDLLVRRTDLAAAELQSHYREKRVMKSVTSHFFQCVAAIADGRYESLVDRHDARFPPASILGDDAAYINAWADEVRGFERIVTLLRTELNDVSDKKSGSNALLRSIEAYGEAVFSASGAPAVESATIQRPGMMKDATLQLQIPVQNVTRDARLLYCDAQTQNGKRERTVTGVEMLQSIADRRKESHTLPPLRSGFHMADVKSAAEAFKSKQLPMGRGATVSPAKSNVQSANHVRGQRL